MAAIFRMLFPFSTCLVYEKQNPRNGSKYKYKVCNVFDLKQIKTMNIQKWATVKKYIATCLVALSSRLKTCQIYSKAKIS